MLYLTWTDLFPRVSTIGLGDGGTAGLIYIYIMCYVGFLAIYASMAEMGSMAPTSGGSALE